MPERCKRICAEVCCLEASGAGAGDVEDVLEVFVEGVEETVGEALSAVFIQSFRSSRRGDVSALTQRKNRTVTRQRG